MLRKITEQIRKRKRLRDPKKCLRTEEEKIKVYGYLDDNFPRVAKKVRQISMELDYDVLGAYSFCLSLLENVNAHSEMAEVQKIFEKYAKE